MVSMDKKTERDLEQYVSDVPDGQYDKILAADDRYDIFLHLSRMRHSLLNWYPFHRDASILEVGGGYGALTEFLCQAARKVTTVVSTKEKARIIEKRCRRFENLDIIVGSPDALAINKKCASGYNYVIMTGVLEYCCGGYKGIGPYREVLKNILNFAEDDGIILISAENRYGLRYFCGERDPVTNVPFAGLNRYPQGSGGYVFSRKEIIDMLSEVPGIKYKFYYPLPDYHFPQLIYTDNYLPGENIRERLLAPTRDMSTLLMDEKRLYDDVIANGAFPFMSNSFLIECSRKGELNETEYVALTTDRGKEHGFATIIKGEKVIKRALYPEGKGAIKALLKNIEDLEGHGIRTVSHRAEASGLEISMPKINLPTLSQVLKKTIRTDPKQYKEWFWILYKEILSSSEPGIFEKSKYKAYDARENAWGPILKKAYIDMVPINCFADKEKKQLIFFDQEFVEFHIPAGYIMFRALKYTYLAMPFAKEIIPLTEMKREFGLEEVWSYYAEEERRFVEANRDYQTYGNFNKWCKRDSKKLRMNGKRLQAGSLE